MSGGGGGSTTTKQEPWEGAQPFLQELYGEAQNLYRTSPLETFSTAGPGGRIGAVAAGTGAPLGGLAGYFDDMGLPGQALARGAKLGATPFTRDEQTAQGMARSFAQQRSPVYREALGGLADTVQGDYLGTDPYSRMALAGARGGGVLGGANDQFDEFRRASAGKGFGQANRMLGSFAQGAAGRGFGAENAFEDIARGTAEGQFLGSNPYLDRMWEGASRQANEAFAEETLPALTGQFAGAGRFGSGLHYDTVQDAGERQSRALGDTAANLYGGAYESERDRMLQAAGLGGQLAEARFGRQLQSAGQAAGLHEAEYGRRMGAAQQAAGLDEARRGRAFQAAGLGAQQYGAERERMLRAAGLAPSVAGAQTQDQLQRIGLLNQMGAQQRGLADQILGFQAGAYDQAIRTPYETLGFYQNLVAGNPASGLMSQSQPYYRNQAATSLGGLGSGAAMGAMVGGPWGALIGGGLGLGASFF